MKTTLDLPDSLLAEAKACARTERTTLRRLVEDGLRETLAARTRARKPFRLRDGSQHLGGLRVDSWPETRRIIYEGRGE
ncbi:MAG: hypothetical protein ACRD2D_06200 [Terriglobales bacterium]